MGLIDRSEPSRAWAPPMRPPFLRLSSVSSAPTTWVRRARSSTRATTSSADAPPAAASAARSTCVPRPEVIERESTTRTSRSPRSALAAFWADCIVADRSEERLMQTTASAPASCWRRKAASNLPGAGAAVSGSTARRRPASRRSASTLSSVRSSNSSSPKRIDRGTTSMPWAATSSSVRSQLLSVTMRTAMAPKPSARAPRQGANRPRRAGRCAGCGASGAPTTRRGRPGADRQHEAGAGHRRGAHRVPAHGQPALAVRGA